MIEDKTKKWSDFLGETLKHFNSVKIFIYLKVRLVFDPPSSAFVLNSITEQIKEYEFTLEAAGKEAPTNGTTTTV